MGEEEGNSTDAVIELLIRIFNRIRCFEPNNNKNVVKIMSWILLNEDDDILELAFTCDSNLISRISAAKFMLGMSSTMNPQLVDPFEPPYSLYNQESNGGARSWSSRRICHYFMKGYCKFGENCRFEHPKVSYASDEHRSTTTLEQLETEIAELLRSRRGRPVSIALLPTLYSAKYGKALHADGYLTESQRHGEAVGCSLTKLLSRMRNSIRVVDRPHGQRLVVLAEDAAKYAECRRNERSETSAAATTCSSDQIYLTFSAESRFTIEDVADYFRQFGPVREVRIPCQDRRMFGFVSFYDADTVDEILRNRKPHFICGDRVLVKPYRANSRNGERSYLEKTEPANCYAYHQHLDPFIVPRESYWSPLPQSHWNSTAYSPFVSCNTERVLEDPNEFEWKDHIRYESDDSNCPHGNDEGAEQSCNSCADQERSQIELPESPFESESESSTVVYRDYKEKPSSVLQSIDRSIVRSRA